MKTRKYVLMALLSSMALGLYALECVIPPLTFIPGAKLGLANIITMVAIYIFGKKEAFLILMMRIVIASMLFGQVMSMLYSVAGGLFSFVALCICLKFIERSSMWATGIICAIFHNLGQIVVAVLVTQQLSIAYYFLFLVIISMISGVFTGVCADYCITYAQKILKHQKGL
ncbi:MAG: Gx transporter family protein [Ruminococcaceae bacterium]|nr:Gx transporter family protein [Oscillospiraceae bacterium]